MEIDVESDGHPYSGSIHIPEFFGESAVDGGVSAVEIGQSLDEYFSHFRYFISLFLAHAGLEYLGFRLSRINNRVSSLILLLFATQFRKGAFPHF